MFYSSFISNQSINTDNMCRTALITQKWAVKLVAAYVIAGWAIMEILYFGVWCRPFNNYWAVPVDNGEWKYEKQ